MNLPLGFQLAPQFLVDIADEVLVFFNESVGLSWGMSIVALTVCMRTLLIPLTYKQIKGMRAMQALQPQIKELQAKYKNDKQRMQQEMMRFYKENNVNPFASCVPLVAQLPVFITLFYVLQHDLREDICGKTLEASGKAFSASNSCGSYAETAGEFGESFFFISDLTAKATGTELIVLLVIYVSTQLISGMVMAVTADKSQRMLMFLLPLFFVPFVISFPAGLLVYWISTNIWTIGQSFAVKKLIPVPVAATPQGAAAVAEAKAPPKPPKKKKRKRR